MKNWTMTTRLYNLQQSFSKVFMKFEQVFSGIFFDSSMVTHSSFLKFLASNNLF